MVVLARAARSLAEQVSWPGFFEFAVIFGMLWMAWMNGTVYHEIHGREDGRTRVFAFLQMLVLALLAVFTGGAAGENGAALAVTYSAFLVVLFWLRQRVLPPRHLALSGHEHNEAETFFPCEQTGLHSNTAQ